MSNYDFAVTWWTPLDKWMVYDYEKDERIRYSSKKNRAKQIARSKAQRKADRTGRIHTIKIKKKNGDYQRTEEIEP